MRTTQVRDLAVGTVVHLARFGVILGGLAVAPLIGVHGWYAGLFVNVLCSVFAICLVTYYGLWSRIGIGRRWAGRAAVPFVLVLLVEAPADFTVIHALQPHGDAFAATTAVVFVGIGIAALRRVPRA